MRENGLMRGISGNDDYVVFSDDEDDEDDEDDDDDDDDDDEPNNGLSPQTRARTTHLAIWSFKE